MGQVDVDDPGLHAREAVERVDLEHVAHARRAEHHAALDRRRAAGEPGARAARDDRDARLVQQPHRAGGLVGAAREHDQLGPAAQQGQAVALVGEGQGRVADDPDLAHHRTQPLDQARVHQKSMRESRHQAKASTAARKTRLEAMEKKML